MAAGAQPEDQPAALNEEEEYDRRTILTAGAGLAALAALGFGALQLLGGDSSGGDQTPLERVPANSDVVVHGSLAALLSDPAFRSAVDDQLTADGGEDLGTMLDSFETGTGIDFRDAENMTVFAASENGASAGAIFEPSISPDRIRPTAEQSGRLVSESEYEGRPVSVVDSPEFGRTVVICDLGGGEIALGSRAAVEGAVDRKHGDAEPLSGGVREGFTAASDGVARSGFVIPEATLNALGVEGFTAILLDVEYGYAALPDGADGELRISLRAPSDGDADSLAQALDSLPTLLESGDVVTLPEGIDDSLLDALAGLSATASGQVVEVTIPDGYIVLAVLLGYALS